ncbi:MAG: hypothetical protein ACI837_000406 [Crocinitomicaceae bacterium]|jgi:hypothetical protein
MLISVPNCAMNIDLWTECLQEVESSAYFLFLRSVMNSIKKYIGTLILVMFCGTAFSQNPKIDRLEVNFSQRHYKRTYRLANRLLDKPEYDFSMLPRYYKAISLFQLSQNDFWLLRHDNSLELAEELFLEVKYSEHGSNIFNAHMYEISWLRSDLVSWASDLKRMGYQKAFEEVESMINRVFDGVPVIDAGNTATDIVEVSEVTGTSSGVRNDIIVSAQKHIGTPYVWAGSSPGGFDCSGFTSYVLKEHGQTIPRRAQDQYASSKKIKAKDAQQGDLVFFNNGSGVSHVGIVVSGLGESLKMIHASSGQGIVITDVIKSKYWTQRIHGYGTFLN